MMKKHSMTDGQAIKTNTIYLIDKNITFIQKYALGTKRTLGNNLMLSFYKQILYTS